jgi:hypothetical protein
VLSGNLLKFEDKKGYEDLLSLRKRYVPKVLYGGKNG